MDALFILNDAGSLIVEKHFQGRIGRSVCDPFLDLLQTHAERGSSRSTSKAASAAPYVPSLWSIPKLSSDQQPPSHYAEGRLTYDGAKEGSLLRQRRAPGAQGWAISCIKLDTLELSSIGELPALQGLPIYSTRAGHIAYRL
ncbi:unnamed protein product [Vitrella brassicaformis CCMP3155]|uniref:Uncharacterized protein n=1 Tax=Vitrella brassicaformis (strain CCMP3155) TaxID=1169540 RepID=A0A0G4FLM2_VITBC|nr:unnamed protein product [Vitrella brassicaformis CCMP3155]|eukprot:CEM14820.1 unnamed protein product [Vitrella brassicaformis CCMP3155]